MCHFDLFWCTFMKQSHFRVFGIGRCVLLLLGETSVCHSRAPSWTPSPPPSTGPLWSLIDPDIQLMSLSLSVSFTAASRQRRLLRQLLDHQDVPVEEERQRRLRVQRLRPLPEAALGTSSSHSPDTQTRTHCLLYWKDRKIDKNQCALLKGSLLRVINLFPQRPPKCIYS